MNAIEFLKIIADLFHSPIGFFLILFWSMYFLFWSLSFFVPDESSWKAWEGSIITAIKRAEKQAESITPQAFSDKSLAKLEMALEYVLQDYEKVNRGKKPSPKLTEQFRQAIQVKHHEITRWGY